MEIKNVYFDAINQKISWSNSDKKKLNYNYELIGESTRVEFDLFIQLLWYRYEDSNIDPYDLKKMFKELRGFCDSIKQNYNL